MRLRNGNLLQGPAQWPYTLSPHDTGMVIEDVWPTIFFGRERVPEIRRKIQKLKWAASAFEQMKREAEAAIKGPPQVPIEPAGWRHDFYSLKTGEHFLYDPQSPNLFFDPWSGEYETGDAHHRAWALLTHERTQRMMRSIAFLYALTGNERCAEWVAEAMRRELEMFSHREFRSEARTGALFFQPLYDAPCLTLLASAYDLTRSSPAYKGNEHRAIREGIFEEGIPYQLKFLEKSSAHNMSCYVSAAVASVGCLLERQDWIDIGLRGKRTGLRALLKDGVRTDRDGVPDGFWFEGTMFYHYYSLCPLITLFELDRKSGGKTATERDMLTRFKAMFQAPVDLADHQLRLPCLGDLGAPKVMNLRAYRYCYEYAAGELDPKQFGPLLATLYKDGAPRNSLTALAFGPDKLPKPGGVRTGATVMKRPGICVFRSGKDNDSCYLLFRVGPHGAGHDHPDKLEVALHALGLAISPDPGTAGYSVKHAHGFYRSTLAHNTLFVDEQSQAIVHRAAFDCDPDANPPRAKGVIRDAYPGVKLERTVFFDPPCVILSDVCSSREEHRYGWGFHAYGSLNVSVSRQASLAEMPPLPKDGMFAHLTARDMIATDGTVCVNWRIAERVWLRLIATSDGPIEVTSGRTIGQPVLDDRGTVILRAAGKKRRFYAVLEVHRGAPAVTAITLEKGGAIAVAFSDGKEKCYDRR